ncbi:MAG: peptidylprolyl isomerase, partial [Clostridia bacterium]|nr:peptidylprolyl isomerase [Clostridia bacterium]
ITPITEKDKKDYYNNNYYRFKYILLETTDDKDKALPADEIIYKRNLAEDLYQRVLNGESFEDLIPQYSEDYAKITDKMTAEEKAEAEKSNTAAVTDGLICDKDGIFNRTLYNYYDICVNSKIVSRLEELKVGDVSVVEIDNSIWVIKEYDINEKDSYYEGKEEAIFQSLYGPDISNKYTMWMAELNYEFNDDVLAELDPGTFTDLFSEVYNLEKEDK